MKDIFAIVLIIVIASLLYALTIRGIYGNVPGSIIKNNLDQAGQPFELSPERGRYAHVLALGERGTYELGPQLAEVVYPDVGYYNGKFYSFFAPGISYLAMPFYRLGRPYNLAQVSTFAFVSVVSVLALVVLFKIAREILGLSLAASLLAVLIFAFGSPAWSYAITLYQHHVTVFLILSSFYAVWRYKQRGASSWAWGFWVWLAYGVAIAIDYPNALLMLPVMVYFLLASLSIRRTPTKIAVSLRPAIIVTSLAFIVVTGLHFEHNAYFFGKWSNLSSTLVGYKTIKEKQLMNEPNFASTVQNLQEKKSVAIFFTEEALPFGFYTLTFSPDRGLFLYAPIFLLALAGMYSMRKSLNLEYSILLTLVGVNFLLYSSWGDPWGGWAYGPRYLIPSMAILPLFIAVWFSSWRHTIWEKLGVFALFLYSSAVGLLGALTTNAVPPKIEGDYLHIKFNFFRNLDFLFDNHSGSFMYNTFFSHSLSLTNYFFIIYSFIVFFAIMIIFVFPLINHES